MELILENKSKVDLIDIIKSLSSDKEKLSNEKDELSIDKEKVLSEHNTFLEKYKNLEFQLEKLKAILFGRKTEKFKPKELEQRRLFNEAEINIQLETISTNKEELDEKETYLFTKVSSHTRKKTGRIKIPDLFPRTEIYNDLDENKKTCSCGCKMEKFGEEVSEKLDVIPAQIFVNRYIRPKYVCKKCKGNHENVENEVHVAPPVPQFLPKALAEEGMIAYSLISKFADSIPFYRQCNIFQRSGLEISRSTLCNYSMMAHEKLKYIDKEFWEEILKSPYIQVDETPVKVLKVEGKSKDSKSYMFVIKTLIRGKPVIRYLFNPTRSAGFLKEKLKNYRGIMQTDGWRSYDTLVRILPNLTHAGCWVHARREFIDIIKTSKTHKGSNQFVGLIGELYDIESKIKHFSNEEKLKIRKSESKRIVDAIRLFLDEESTKVLLNTPYGKALKYMDRQWSKLIKFLDYPDLPLDTNVVENAIRPFVVGRKNWLFSGTDTGAEASAFFYSLIETAKANLLDPYSFLKDFMTKVKLGEQPEFFGWVH